MSDDDRGPADAAYLGPLDVDVLVDEVIASFTPRIREAIRREDVVAVFRDLDLGERRLIRRATRLSVRWLRFSGAKGGGEDGTAIPFTYEQRFASGVNIIHIPDNQVGKSSIMKTIKFALTGDNGDYDTDVKRWITDISLTFALDNHPFTVIIASGDDGFQALLIDGEEQGGLKAALQGGREVIFDASDAANLKEEFKQFFFQRLGLKALSWTQASSTKDGTAAERSTSWLTYFQILLMPEGGDKYLLCDPTHAIGNQDGLIFSSFLGLNLTEPINQLGVEAKKAKKEVEHTRQQAQQAVQEAEQLIARLEDELRAKHTAADTLVREQRARRQALEDGDLARKLSAAQRALVEKSAEREELLARRETLNREIAQDRSRAKRLREAIELQLHFTGLEVRLCPNCDTAVAAEAISREQTAHVCRLCGHQAHDADPETIEALEMQAVELNEFVSRADRERMRLNARLGQLRQEIEQAEAQVGRLRQFASQDLSAALPTEDEEARRAELYQAIGRLQAEIDAANQRKAIDPTSEQTADLHRKIVERVRKKLQEKAEQRNRALLSELDRLTHDMATRIGVESITGVECSSTGKIKLMKSGAQTSFGGLKNEGERLRVKLAFFMAMMRLGREAGLGRHPGFLMIDQPGSSEMVAEDVKGLAQVFRQIDQDSREQLQIICFTARQEFRHATEPDKVYGPQAGKYAF